MSLIDKLQKNGSKLSAANGGKISVNPLATQQSKLHADGNKPGYSVDGSNASTVNSQYQQYNDGAVNILPQPSLLDLNGKQPNKYTDNLPK
jgi:hypothetical protein